MDGSHEESIFSPQSGRTPQGLTVWQSPQSGRTTWGIKIHIHKVDRPYEGSRFMSIKWTDPTRVNCLTKSTKWTDPIRDQYSAHKVDGHHKGLTVWQNSQSGQTPQGINIQSTKWTDTYSNRCTDPMTGSIFNIFSEWTSLNEDRHTNIDSLLSAKRKKHS